MARIVTRWGFVLAVILAPSLVWAACGDLYCSGTTCTATDANSSSINAAITEGKTCSGAVTVNVPAGTGTWNGSVALSASGMTADSLHLKGAGGTATQIIHAVGTGPACDANEAGMYITLAASKTIIVSGFYFNGSTVCTDNDNPVRFIYVTGNGQTGLRVTGNTFTHTYKNYALQTVNAFGVIDGNNFHNGKPLVNGGNTTAEWTSTDTGLGTANFLFIENNTFTRTIAGNAVDANNAGRFVFRYNTAQGNWIEGHHYYTATYNALGTRAFEIYNNAMTTGNISGVAWTVYMRGGTGVIYSNTFAETDGRTIASGVLALYDDNVCNGLCLTYPCMGQVGRGRDQALEPIYQWNNTKNGNTLSMDAAAGACHVALHGFIQADRDFYNAEKPYYAPYTCPHPLTGLTGSCTTTAGRGGYNVGGGGPGYGVITLGAGGTGDLGAGGIITLGP